MSFAGYDAWKLAYPPEYELGEPDDDDCCEHDEEVVCPVCDVRTLKDFVHPVRDVPFIESACEECEDIGF